MKWALSFVDIEKLVVQDRNFLYTGISYSATLAIFLNLNAIQSPLIGFAASVIYFLINAVFLENAFFEKEDTFFRLMLGILLLIVFLGLVGWLTLIIYNLDATRVTLVLLVVATFSSLLNRRMRHRNAAP
jgi:hypothetical protein